jgi:TetR/AcrR family transcriptional regulator, mexJK operon transcriptional repressor
VTRPLCECPSPRGDARRKAIIDAAWQVFLEKGFERATLGEIISLSKGSRTTLYEAFGGKEGLFETMIVDKCRTVIDSLQLELREGIKPDQVLLEFATRFTEEIFTHENPKIIHLVVSESQRFPKVAEYLFRHGPDRVQQKVADYFRAATAAGELTVEDPDLAADLFLSLIQGQWQFRLLARTTAAPSKEQLHRQVALAIRIFLQGVSPSALST